MMRICRPPESFDGIVMSTQRSRRKYFYSVLHVLCGLGFLSFLIFLFWIVSVIAGLLPTPLKISDEVTRPDAFIAERAYNKLKILTDFGPRVTGFPPNEEATVDFLKGEIQEVIQSANKQQQIEFDIQAVSGNFSFLSRVAVGVSSYAEIQNVVVKLHGANDTAYSLLLNSHFDSVPTSPGASDDGINVVTMLEVLRLVSKAEVRPKFNIIFLFNGAEETPLQGSHGFITKHKWARECKVVINLDSCGHGGRSILFQTGPRQPWLMKYYSKVPHPYAQVAGEEIFQTNLIPSGTDFKIFVGVGDIVGLDMAFFKNGYVYHTKFDDMNKLPLGSLQNIGDNVLSLTRDLANAPELTETKQTSDGNVVYFDFLGAFVLYYTEQTGMIINLLTVAFSVGVFLNAVRSLNLDCDCESWKYLGMVFGGVLAGWICSVIFVVVLALMLDAVGFSMTWFARTWLIFGLYVTPTITISAVFLLFVQTKNLTEHMEAEVEAHVVRFIWTLVLFIIAVAPLRGAYIICIPVLFNSIAFIVISLVRIKWSVENWQYIYIFTLIIPTMFLMYEVEAIMSLFIPITGRIGSDKNPDIIIGVLSAFFTILITSSFIPLIKMMCSPRWFLGTLLTLFVISFIVALCSGFPYQNDGNHPTPQRYWIMHTDRIMHGKTGAPIKRESGYFLLNMDRNSPIYVQQYSDRFKEARGVEEDCRRYLFCGYPMAHSAMATIIQYSTWIPAEAPDVPSEATKMVINSKENVSQNIIKYNLTVSGPNRLVVYLSPTQNLSLVNMSLIDVKSKPITNDGRELYYIMHTYGKRKSPLTFTFNVNVSEHSNASYIEIAVCGIYIDLEEHTTDRYKEFLHSFPDWSDVTAWTGTYESWMLPVG